MMTKEKAFAFVSGFAIETRARWFAALLAYQWPSDLPFFACPIALHGRLSAEGREALMRDPVWNSFREALATTLPSAVRDRLVLSSYSVVADGLEDIAEAFEEFHQAHASTVLAMAKLADTLGEEDAT
jgi:hypothetical protein